MSESVTWLTASWPGGYSDGSAAVSTDRLFGDLVERNCHVVSNRPVALNPQVITSLSESPRRSEPADSASSPVSVVLGPGDVYQSPDSHRRARTIVVGARSATQPLVGNNCAVQAHCRELRRLNRCLPITARGRHDSALM